MHRSINPCNTSDLVEIPVLPGIFRTPLAYTKDGNLNYFELKKGTTIPLHAHDSSQIGYILQGKLRFFTESTEFIAKKGDSYAFEGNEKHGAEIIEDALVLDFFSPLRKDYLPSK